MKAVRYDVGLMSRFRFRWAWVGVCMPLLLPLVLVSFVAIPIAVVDANYPGETLAFPPRHESTIQLASPLDLTGGTGAVAAVQKAWLQSVFNISVNLIARPGNGGAAGMAMVRDDPPTGYYWTMGQTPSVILQPLLLSDANFNKTSFKTVYIHSYTPVLAISSATGPIATWGDFVALCLRVPVNCTAAGSGLYSSYHSLAVRASKAFGITIIYYPYQGFTQTVTALRAGIISLAFTTSGSITGVSGIIPIALGSDYPFASLPDTPTFSQLTGISFVEGVYRGVMVPPDTPEEICRNISATMEKLQRTQAYQTAMTQIGAVITFLRYGPTLDDFMADLTQTMIDVFIPPVPTPPELQQPNEIALAVFMGLGSLGLLASIGFGVVLVLYWQSAVFKASSRVFCGLILLGVALGYLLVILLSIASPFGVSHKFLSDVCTAYPWLLCMSFNIIFGCLFAKNYRLYAIFQIDRTKLTREKITDGAVFSRVMIFVGIDTVILVVWTALYPPQLVDQTPFVGASGVELYRQQCSSKNGNVFFDVLLALKITLLVVGLGMSYLLRNIKSAFNETKAIAFSIYNLCLWLAIVLALLTLLENLSSTGQLVLVSSGIWMSTTATLCSLFIPKLISINKTEADLMRDAGSSNHGPYAVSHNGAPEHGTPLSPKAASKGSKGTHGAGHTAGAGGGAGGGGVDKHDTNTTQDKSQMNGHLHSNGTRAIGAPASHVSSARTGNPHTPRTMEVQLARAGLNPPTTNGLFSPVAASANSASVALSIVTHTNGSGDKDKALSPRTGGPGSGGTGPGMVRSGSRSGLVSSTAPNEELAKALEELTALNARIAQLKRAAGMTGGSPSTLRTRTLRSAASATAHNPPAIAPPELSPTGAGGPISPSGASPAALALAAATAMGESPPAGSAPVLATGSAPAVTGSTPPSAAAAVTAIEVGGAGSVGGASGAVSGGADKSGGLNQPLALADI